jgi:tRNA-uridine 2-sulfurtransferase
MHGIRNVKIAVAMSGGLDSSVTAALLKDAGHEVFGITMLVVPANEAEGKRVPNVAGDVAKVLGIPHYTIDLREIFEKHIISEFCEQYSHGRTPNPCVQCNRFIKFSVLYDKAREFGADMLATGHYARIEQRKSDGRHLLLKGSDRRRDQSYFLYALTQEQLSRSLFPLGTFTKSRVRQIASEMKLPVASTESREICFIPDNNYIGFLAKRVISGNVPGTIKDVKGNVLGEHRGIINYTIGQRKRLGVSSEKPLYVVTIDSQTNTIVIGDREHIFNTEFTVSKVNWIANPPPSEPLPIKVKVRYLHPEVEAIVTPITGNTVRVKFGEPQMSITSGQSAVFYDGDVVVGGGTIEEVVRS